MNVHYTDDAVTLWHGDCIEVMRQLPDASVDAVVTDPPYGLEFMGKEWDRPWAVSPTQGVGFAGREDNLTLPSFGDNRNANCRGCGGRQRGKKRCACDVPDWDRKPGNDMAEFQAWCLTWTTELYRVLKPGGHLLAFGGTRTWHRLACAIEDAGFEVRDSIAWMYGSGFPKSLNLKDEWQGWGTALKPAFEPVVVARKPLVGTVAANVERYGTGALNIDGCRIGTGEDKGVWPVTDRDPRPRHGSTVQPTETDTTQGRWPANVILDESQAAELDRQSGVSRDGVAVNRNRTPDNDRAAYSAYQFGQNRGADVTYGGEGGASRFFYTAKADSSERPRVDGVAHPTVKPLDLMRYLVRLVTPPGGVVLEPFAGSGTTLEACIVEGFRCIGIEREADYIPLIMARITKPIEVTLL